MLLLFQSVRELLINSAKHSGTGQASLTMDQRADFICITVRDEGKGFDPADAGAPHDGLSSKFGLLSIQERMRALRGSCEIESAPDKGTTARLIMPLLRPVAHRGAIKGAIGADPTVISDHAQQADPGHSSMIRVVLVDDHAMIRQGLRTMLEGYKDIHIVDEAANGEEAITFARSIQPDVMLMDINMPKLNGIEATGVIKRLFPNIAIVGLSVNADRGIRAAMIKAGAATLLTKEAPVEELCQAIHQAVRTSPLRQARQADVQVPQS
jgi:CheY-like chemotaxis protein